MKVVTVNVQIQMDVSEDKDTLTQVLDTLETVDNIIYEAKLDNQPVIFISGVDKGDIIEEENEDEDEN